MFASDSFLISRLPEQYGEEAVKEGMGPGGPGGGMADIFDLFGGGGGRRQTRERRGDNVTHRLKTSLEEMYTGALRYSIQAMYCRRPLDMDHQKALFKSL